MPTNVVPIVGAPQMEVRPPKPKLKPRPPPPKPNPAGIIIGEDPGTSNGHVGGIMGSSGMFAMSFLSSYRYLSYFYDRLNDILLL